MSLSKKARYIQSYKDAYTAEGICASDHGDTEAYCSYCKQHFSIGHGGLHDIKRHKGTQKHLSCMADSKKNAAMAGCMSKFVSGQSFDTLESSVLKAEVMFTETLVKLNLPISAADTLNKIIPAAFPDSAILISMFLLFIIYTED